MKYSLNLLKNAFQNQADKIFSRNIFKLSHWGDENIQHIVKKYDKEPPVHEHTDTYMLHLYPQNKVGINGNDSQT